MVIDTKEKYEAFLERVKAVPVLAMDTETEEFTKTKRHAFDLELDGIGIYGQGVHGFILTNVLDKKFQAVLDSAEKIVWHNFKFDGVVLKKYGFSIDNIKYEDTYIMSLLLNENRSSHKLKDLAKSVLRVDEKKIVEFREVSKRPVKEEYGLFPDSFEADYKAWIKKLSSYCVDDCKYTYKLYSKFYPKMKEQGLLKVYEKIELPLIKVVMAMEERGIKIDTEYLKDIKEKAETDIIKLQTIIWKEAGRQFDINSPKQLSEILFTERGYTLPDDYKTPKGVYSTNEASLRYLSEQYSDDNLLQNLFMYRELFKLNSAFISGLIERNTAGVIYPSFRQIGTVTGRFSCSGDVNLQQLPREAKYDIRKAFIAREGYIFVDIDLSQVELRMAAYFAQDPVMIKAFNEGKDIHQEMADLLGCDRTRAKGASFGILYGTSAYGFAKHWGITVDEATQFLKTYFNKFKSLEIFIAKCKNTIRHKYAVTTIAGRKRRFPQYAEARKNRDYPAMSRIDRMGVNSVIQGSSADLIKYQMLKVFEALKGKDAHILVQIHDEIIIECPEGNAQEIYDTVKNTMETALLLKSVPLIAEGHISKYWKK